MKKYWSTVRTIILVLVGSSCYALALNLFLVRNNIAAGGFSGIATVIHYLTGLPVGAMVLFMNIPLFFLSWKSVGHRFFAICVASTVIMSVAIDMFASLPLFTTDRLMASVYGGVLSGFSVGLLYHAGGASGGSDLLARLINRIMPHVSIGRLLIIIDGIVIIFAAIIYKNAESALYAAITIYIAARITDASISGLDYAKVCFIITTKSQEISDNLLKSSTRGITRIAGTGLYTGQGRDVLMTVVKKNQIIGIKSAVKIIDPEAFVIVSDATEVLGKGFKPIG